MMIELYYHFSRAVTLFLHIWWHSIYIYVCIRNAHFADRWFSSIRLAFNLIFKWHFLRVIARCSFKEAGLLMRCIIKKTRQIFMKHAVPYICAHIRNAFSLLFSKKGCLKYRNLWEVQKAGRYLPQKFVSF